MRLPPPLATIPIMSVRTMTPIRSALGSMGCRNRSGGANPLGRRSPLAVAGCDGGSQLRSGRRLVHGRTGRRSSVRRGVGVRAVIGGGALKEATRLTPTAAYAHLQLGDLVRPGREVRLRGRTSGSGGVSGG